MSENQMLIKRFISGKEEGLEELAENLSVNLAANLKADYEITSELEVIAEILNSYFLSTCECLSLSSICFLSNFEKEELSGGIEELVEIGLLHHEGDKVYHINLEFLEERIKEIF